MNKKEKQNFKFMQEATETIKVALQAEMAIYAGLQ